MSITNGPNIGVMVNGASGEAHYTQFMAFMRAMDMFAMPNVKGYRTNTPPGSPADGDAYIIGAAPTGAWAGKAGLLTRYSSVAVTWEFFTPKNGWMIQANSARETYRYTASAWEVYYQEGTWTPAFQGTTTPGTGQTYSLQDGSYIKKGSEYTARFHIAMTSLGTAGGNIEISGLPASSPSGVYQVGMVSHIDGLTFPASRTYLGVRVSPSSAAMLLLSNGSGTTAGAVPVTNASSSIQIIGSITYRS